MRQCVKPATISGCLIGLAIKFMALVYVNDPVAVDAKTARIFKALADAPIPVEVVLVSPKAGVAPEGLRVFRRPRRPFRRAFRCPARHCLPDASRSACCRPLARF
jgi:hypothetical protein